MVRQGTANPSFPGSNPGAAFNYFEQFAIGESVITTPAFNRFFLGCPHSFWGDEVLFAAFRALNNYWLFHVYYFSIQVGEKAILKMRAGGRISPCFVAILSGNLCR